MGRVMDESRSKDWLGLMILHEAIKQTGMTREPKGGRRAKEQMK